MVKIFKLLLFGMLSLLLNSCSGFMDNMIDGIYIIPPEKVRAKDRNLQENDLEKKYYRGFRLGENND